MIFFKIEPFFMMGKKEKKEYLPSGEFISTNVIFRNSERISIYSSNEQINVKRNFTWSPLIFDSAKS